MKEERLVESGGDAGDKYALKAVGGAYKGWCDVRDKEEMDCGNKIIFAVMTLVGKAINQLFCFCF